jgi:hypothetical protein
VLSGQTTFSGLGQVSQLTVTGKYSDGSSHDLTSLCTWQSEDAGVARVSAGGLLTTVAYGTTRAAAFYQSLYTQAWVIVKVTDVPPQVPIDVAALVGTWRNVNLNSSGTTRMDFRLDQGRIVVHGWGSCLPTDCDWGEVSTPLSDAGDGVLSVTWSAGFSIMTQEFRLLQDGRLESSLHTHYLDGSGRVDFDEVEYLRK